LTGGVSSDFGASMSAGADPAAGATGAGSSSTTAVGTGGGTAGTVSRGGACLNPAQPVASKQEIATTPRVARAFAGMSINTLPAAGSDASGMPPRIAPHGSHANPGAPKTRALNRRKSVRLAFYENHESFALLSHSLSCFSASSLAMP
jgi:hypothetical protein